MFSQSWRVLGVSLAPLGKPCTDNLPREIRHPALGGRPARRNQLPALAPSILDARSELSKARGAGPKKCEAPQGTFQYPLHACDAQIAVSLSMYAKVCERIVEYQIRGPASTPVVVRMMVLYAYRILATMARCHRLKRGACCR